MSDFLSQFNEINHYPIYYLFDGFINSNIGFTKEQVKYNLEYNNRIYKPKVFNSKFLKIFEIDENSLIFYNINKHAICGHFFDFNREKYFYLSNSGLGCNNHFTYTDKNKTNYILPKIYKIQYESQLTNLTDNFTYIRNTLFGSLVEYKHKPVGFRTEHEQDKFNNIKIFLDYIKTNIMG